MSKTIVMFNGEDREINMSLYDFIDEQYRKANPIMVCHITEKEYDNVKKQLKSGNLYERLSRIKPENIGYNKFRYVIAYDKLENNLLVSDYENPNKIGNYRIDTDGIHYDEKGYQITHYPTSRFPFSIKVYTTESYKEIIAHYEAIHTKDALIQQKTKELIDLIGHHCRTCNTECSGGLGDNNNCSRWSHIIS